MKKRKIKLMAFSLNFLLLFKNSSRKDRNRNCFAKVLFLSSQKSRSGLKMMATATQQQDSPQSPLAQQQQNTGTAELSTNTNTNINHPSTPTPISGQTTPSPDNREQTGQLSTSGPLALSGMLQANAAGLVADSSGQIRFSGHTMDKATKAKVHLENYYSNLISQHRERRIR